MGRRIFICQRILQILCTILWSSITQWVPFSLMELGIVLSPFSGSIFTFVWHCSQKELEKISFGYPLDSEYCFFSG